MADIEALVMPNGAELSIEATNGVFTAIVNTTTYAECTAALAAGKTLFCKDVKIPGDIEWTYPYFLNEEGNLAFGFVDAGNSYHGYYITPSSNWVEVTGTSLVGSIYGKKTSVGITTKLAVVSGGHVYDTNIDFGSSTTKYLANNGTWQNIPTNVSSFTNDAGYLTLSTLPVWDGSIT